MADTAKAPAAHSGPVLEFETVTKRFGATLAVSDLSFAVRPGEICGFLGPNGAGKTTSLRIALGVLAPDAGRASVFGGPPTRHTLERVGFLPEERGVYKRMTAESAIAFFARLKGMAPRAARERARQLLEEQGLGHLARKKLKTFSKGMAQKVQILACLAHDPELVILDEPFSGLDPVNQQTLEALIRRMREDGKTVIFSTHVMEHAERLCDRIVLLARGRKAFEGEVGEALGRVPVRVTVETDPGVDVPALVSGLPGTTAEPAAPPPVIPGAEAGAAETAHWLIHIPQGASAQPILHAFVDAGAPLRRFEPSRPSLHDAFVRLVGEADVPPQTAEEAAAEEAAADLAQGDAR